MTGTATTPQDAPATEPATGTDAGTQATPPAATEPAAAAPAQAAAPAATGTQATPPAPGTTVNRQKHERDMAKLQEQLDAKDAELEGYKGLKDEFEQWKAEQETAKTESALKAAGCHDVVAASARLGEFDGDIEKLKEAAPYLFTSTDNSKSTGGKPKGTPDPEDERTKNMRKVMGLDTEKE